MSPPKHISKIHHAYLITQEFTEKEAKKFQPW